MPLSEKDRMWLRMFHKVTSGRASVEECDNFGVSEERRKEFYNGRTVKRLDAMRKRTRRPLREDWGRLASEDPTDALVESIDRKRGR